MDLCCPASELGRNITGQCFGVAAGHIYIQIFVRLELVEHIVNRDLNISVFRIQNLGSKLNLIDEQIILFVFISRNDPFDILTEGNGISELIIFSLVQFNFDDLVVLYTVLQQILIKQFEQQNGLSASANTGNDFDFSIPHITDYAVQIIISAYHIATSNIGLICPNFKVSVSQVKP